MIICFECTQRTLDLINGFVQNDGYSDISQVISVAVENLRVIRAELGSASSRVFSGGSETGERKRTELDRSPEIAANLELPAGRCVDRPDAESEEVGGIPEVFALSGLEITDDIVLPDNGGQVMTQDLPPWNWIFGMYNRLLPAKANIRALARQMSKSEYAGIPAGNELERVAVQIAKEASLLGEFLRRLDSRAGRKREDSLATAFPDSAQREDKGRLRYASQFVARLSGDLTLSGLLADYAFIKTTESETPVIRLTRAGATFARIPNPVLDAARTGPTERFGTEETQFMLDHICSLVPAEASAFRSIIDAIQRGAETPDTIDAELLRRYQQDLEDQSSSSAQLATQRSGAVSRMCDLGLITRLRNGVRITYKLTARGRGFRERLG